MGWRDKNIEYVMMQVAIPRALKDELKECASESCVSVRQEVELRLMATLNRKYDRGDWGGGHRSTVELRREIKHAKLFNDEHILPALPIDHFEAA